VRGVELRINHPVRQLPAAWSAARQPETAGKQ